MQQVISYFNKTLNDFSPYPYEETQLYEATREADVDSVRFLSQHEGILLDEFSTLVDGGYETPLNCAVRFVEGNDDDDVQVMSKGIQIVDLLREAGGHALKMYR